MSAKFGDTVISRDDKDKGEVRGDGRSCRQVEGCFGRQVPVRWEDGKLTWPCTDGMVQTDAGWKLQ